MLSVEGDTAQRIFGPRFERFKYCVVALRHTRYTIPMAFLHIRARIRVYIAPIQGVPSDKSYPKLKHMH
jgi:hypothetical protein